MRTPNRIPITEAQLMTLMKAIGSTGKGHFANQCNASPNAAAFWFKDKMIPPERLKFAARELHKVADRKNPTKEQLEAKKFLEDVLGRSLFDIASEDLPPSLAERHATRRKLGFHREGLFYDPKNSAELSNVLSELPVEALVDALQKKGWIVNLSRKESV
jgi:hypothetical protein